MALIAHYKFNENTSGDNAELVTNGDMTVPGSWGLGGTWAIADGVATCTGNSSIQYLSQDLTTKTVGRKYNLTYEITANNLIGRDYPSLSGAGLFGNRTLSGAVGTHTYFFVAINESPIVDIRLSVHSDSTGGALSIDNISVKLLAVKDSSGNDHDGLAQQDTDQISAANTRGVGTCFDFNGTSDFIEIGDTSSDVKSIVMWVNPDSVTTHTDYPIDLNGTDYITIVNGTVTKNGFSGGTQIIYVDGMVASTVTANWHLVVLTSTVGFDANDLDIGRKATGYFDGLIDNVMLFDTILNEDQTKALHHGGHGTEIVEVIDLDRRIQRRLI